LHVTWFDKLAGDQTNGELKAFCKINLT